MLAMFFFIALYMQNILGYSPLEAGIRFLPSTLMIVLIAPIAGRLTDRIGPRPLIVTGLSLDRVALFLQSRITVDTGYGLLLPAFMLMGIGIALTMSPMSTAAMNSVDRRRRPGVASGILSMSRMVGGTFGVAAIGALFQQRWPRIELDRQLTGAGHSRTARHLGQARRRGLERRSRRELDRQRRQGRRHRVRTRRVHPRAVELA